MRSVLSFRYQIGLFDTLAFTFEELSYIEGTMPKPVNKPDFSLHPFIIIGGCSTQAGVEKLMSASHDINRNRKSLALCPFNKLTAKLPGSFFIEPAKLKLLFFLKQLLQYLIHVDIL